MVIDLEPILGVRVAAELNRRQLANVVLVLPRWPYAQAVLPVDGLVAALVETSPSVGPVDAPTNVVFVVDAVRERPIGRRAVSDRRADNRYRLAASDLPNLATLLGAGIRRLVKIGRA